MKLHFEKKQKNYPIVETLIPRLPRPDCPCSIRSVGCGSPDSLERQVIRSHVDSLSWDFLKVIINANKHVIYVSKQFIAAAIHLKVYKIYTDGMTIVVNPNITSKHYS